MDHLTRDQLRTLASHKGTPCVSILMPTYHVEAELAQNPIRWKNMLREVRRELKEDGHREPEIEALLAPAQSLLDDEHFWLHMSEGLAGFLSPETTQFFRLPIDFEELVVTGSHFHLKPLFPLIATNNRFFVLALSQNNVRLFQGTHYSMNEVESTEIPKDIMDALLKYEEEERSLQHHSGGAPTGNANRRASVMHGQGRPGDDVHSRPKDLIWRYFHKIKDGVQETLRDERAPLVLAGVSYYLPIYRDVNTYGHLVEDQIIAGNPEHSSARQLHDKAWAIVEPMFSASQGQSIDRFQQQFNTDGGLASSDVKEIIPAAVYGRIDTLFVPIGKHLWGRYDADNNAVEIHDDHRAGDDDLLDLAAVHTYLNGGTVHALKPENMPADFGLAALFRFPADVHAEEV